MSNWKPYERQIHAIASGNNGLHLQYYCFQEAGAGGRFCCYLGGTWHNIHLERKVNRMRPQVSSQGLWRYHDISLEINPKLNYRGRRYAIPWYAGEGWAHVRLKVAVAVHLLTWGYPWRKIHWEKRPLGAPRGTRPDLSVERHGKLPAFWFECRTTDDKKLRRLVKKLPSVRIVKVMDTDCFLPWWNAERSLSPHIKDSARRKRAVLRQRKRTSVEGVEYWAIREGSRSARILYAVRREHNGLFTYLDSGEGWSLSAIQFTSRRRDAFQPLIPGVVGHKEWKGQNPSLM